MSRCSKMKLKYRRNQKRETKSYVDLPKIGAKQKIFNIKLKRTETSTFLKDYKALIIF